MAGTIDSAAQAVISEDMTPTQCRAARSMLRWSQGDLAKHSGVSLTTIRNYEGELTKLIRANYFAIVNTFIGAGIDFVGAGTVSLNPPPPPDKPRGRK